MAKLKSMTFDLHPMLDLQYYCTIHQLFDTLTIQLKISLFIVLKFTLNVVTHFVVPSQLQLIDGHKYLLGMQLV